jgi:single-strand DNA-binding protein
MNINRILFTGNLTADPQLVQAGKGKLVNASLANNQFYTDGDEERQQITTFIDLKIWGNAAENFSKFARQGQEIFVEGELRQDRWEDDRATSAQKCSSRCCPGSLRSVRQRNRPRPIVRGEVAVISSSFFPGLRPCRTPRGFKIDNRRLQWRKLHFPLRFSDRFYYASPQRLFARVSLKKISRSV